jgi:hypothetical protein
MYLTGLFAFESSEAVHTPVINFLKTFSMTLFRTQFNIQIVFVLAVAAHLYEAILSIGVCKELGCDSKVTIFWFIQSFMYGYGSLGLLYDRKEFMKSLVKSS